MTRGLSKNNLKILFKWLNTNYVKVNGDRNPLLMPGNKKVIANIGINCIESEDVHEFLGITIVLNLAFENHIDKLCKKSTQKSNSLARISNYMAVDKRKIILHH